jgi:repressor LexA
LYLTKRQSQILDYLRRTLATQGYAPSLEETAAYFKLSSVGTVHKHLKALEEKGLIRRQWNRSRAIEIVDMPDGKARRLPLLGWVSEGVPIEAHTDVASVAVPEEMLGRSKAFLLQAKGHSLRPESILDGDYVVVEQREKAQDGDTVVALVDGESVTIRRYYREGEQVRLVSTNDQVETSVLPASRCRVQGVVVGVLRRFG